MRASTRALMWTLVAGGLTACQLDSTGGTGGRATGGASSSSSVASSSSGESGPSCTDGVKNGDESDVDCGGVCHACGYHMSCVTSADCEAVCENGKCGTRATTAWRQVPVMGPTGRRAFAMARENTNHPLLFGGVHDLAPSVPETLNDLYRYEVTSWTPIAHAPADPWPAARHSAGFTYDNDADVSVLFGGSGVVLYQDLWSWNGSAWTLWAPAVVTDPIPEARHSAAFAYDPTRHLAVLFGGVGLTGALEDTWVFDRTVAPGHWTKVTAPAHPSKRFAMSVAFDSKSGGVMVFGGTDGVTVFDDQWVFDGTTWNESKPAVHPPKRASGAMARDLLRDRIVLAGGGVFSGLYGDTWEWDGTAWTETTSPPFGQAANAMEFDETSKRVVLFLSHLGTSTPATDTWEHFQIGNFCDASSACGSGFCVNGVCCLQPACGDCERCDTPLSAGICAAIPAGCP